MCIRDRYASAIATTVLQLKEVPARPAEFNGQLALYALEDGVDEATIRTALEPNGTIVKVELVGGWPPAVVYFDSHESALKAVAAGAPLVCKGLATLYNELAYHAKGWCARRSFACTRARSGRRTATLFRDAVVLWCYTQVHL